MEKLQRVYLSLYFEKKFLVKKKSFARRGFYFLGIRYFRIFGISPLRRNWDLKTEEVGKKQRQWEEIKDFLKKQGISWIRGDVVSVSRFTMTAAKKIGDGSYVNLVFTPKKQNKFLAKKNLLKNGKCFIWDTLFQDFVLCFLVKGRFKINKSRKGRNWYKKRWKMDKRRGT